MQMSLLVSSSTLPSSVSRHCFFPPHLPFSEHATLFQNTLFLFHDSSVLHFSDISDEVWSRFLCLPPMKCSSAELFWLQLFILDVSHLGFSLIFKSWAVKLQPLISGVQFDMDFNWDPSLEKHLIVSILYLGFCGLVKILITLGQAVLATFWHSIWLSSFLGSKYWVGVWLCAVVPSTI